MPSTKMFTTLNVGYRQLGMWYSRITRSKLGDFVAEKNKNLAFDV